MITEVLNMLRKIAPSYTVTIEEQKMMNVVADTLKKDGKFIYVEEYRKGTYVQSYGVQRVDQLDIYFCLFVDMQGLAIERDKIREIIEREAVLPFVKQWTKIYQTTRVSYYIEPPHFDANEISIRLSVEYIHDFC